MIKKILKPPHHAIVAIPMRVRCELSVGGDGPHVEGMEPWALLPFCKAPGKRNKENRAALKVPAKLFLRAIGLGGK